jgi:hypothetical protein
MVFIHSHFGTTGHEVMFSFMPPLGRECFKGHSRPFKKVKAQTQNMAGGVLWRPWLLLIARG